MFAVEDFNQNTVMDDEFAYDVSEDCEVFGYFYQMLFAKSIPDPGYFFHFIDSNSIDFSF